MANAGLEFGFLFVHLVPYNNAPLRMRVFKIPNELKTISVEGGLAFGLFLAVGGEKDLQGQLEIN
jgi:hypothetical protein